ncbi:MAG: nucleotide-binding protein, partial [Acidobacteriota bacterium]|nr:nucleotide-binding protein [Acidobacteriota bacterium]
MSCQKPARKVVSTFAVHLFITQAGVIVAEVSVPNPNLYYEIGLADALGKPVFLFKQASATLPADFGGVHYYPYDINDLEAGR